MNPVTIAAVLLAIVGGALESQQWAAVTALVRRPFHGQDPRARTATSSGQPTGEAELAALERAPADERRALALAEVLVARASADVEFKAALEDWWKQVNLIGSDEGNVLHGRDFGNTPFGERQLDSQGEAHEALSTVVADYGQRVLSDPRMIANLVTDLLPDLPRERSLLVTAAEADVAGELSQRVQDQHLDPDTAVHLVARSLTDRRAIDPGASMWVTTEYARALGYPVRPGAQPSPWPAPPPVVGPAPPQTVTTPPAGLPYYGHFPSAGGQPQGPPDPYIGPPAPARWGSRRTRRPRRALKAREQAQREAQEAAQRKAEEQYRDQAGAPLPRSAEDLWARAVGYDDLVRSAFAELVQPGRLLFNPPDRMQLGQTERVEVRLTRTLKRDKELLEHLRGHGEPQLEEIPTAPLMAVTLKGDGFQITAYSDEEQSVSQDDLTTWEFDIRALRRGHQRLVLSVSLRIPVPGQPSEHKSIPVREAMIDVQVGPAALVGHFVVGNWQWFIGTAIAIAAVVAAVLFH